MGIKTIWRVPSRGVQWVRKGGVERGIGYPTAQGGKVPLAKFMGQMA